MSILASLRYAAAPVGAALLSLLAAAGARAVPFAVTYTDDPGFGFNDTSRYIKPPFSPTNPGTLGAARRAALESMMENWGSHLEGTIPITVDAAFESMGGSAGGAVLAYASPNYLISRPMGDYPVVWYTAANIAQITGEDGSPGDAMIITRFNSDVDGPAVLGPMGFYYGLDGVAGTDIDFYHVTLHEFGHGLGILSLVEAKANAKGVVGPTGEYLNLGEERAPGIFDLFLADRRTGTSVMLADMTAAQRKAALVKNALYFDGANAVDRNGGNAPRIFAPTTWQSGSSASHLDETSYSGTLFAPSTNELMTPYAGPGPSHSPGPAVTGIMQDMGWVYTPYTMADAAQSLRIASGLDPADGVSLSRLNVTAYTTFPGAVDMGDALKIARMVAGAEANPNP